MVLGHGTTQNAESSVPVFQHAAELRRRKIFAEVREAFWKQEPQVKQVLAGLSTPRIFIAPLFISEGFFSNDVIPRELGFIRRFKQAGDDSPSPGGEGRGEGERKDYISEVHSHPLSFKTEKSEWFYCQPVGTHSRMTEVLLARAWAVAEQFPFPHAPKPKSTTLFIAGHGTGQNENSRKAIEHQAELIRARD